MVIGTISIPEAVGQYDYKRFKEYYKQVVEGKTEETVDEVYIRLGGKPPKKARPQAESTKE